MSQESWRDVPGYNGLYMVSDHGRIYSCRRKRLMALSRSSGYLMSVFSDGVTAKGVKIHRIVLLAFKGADPKRCYANHKNGIKTDNRLVNLEWVTPGENAEHAYANGLKPRPSGVRNPRAMLSVRDVANIRSRASSGELLYKIANDYGVNPTTAGRIASRKSWRHLKTAA